MRHERRITIEDEGRDKGKTFLLTEMSAVNAEKWAIKAMLAIGRAGIDIPADVMDQGMAGLVATGISHVMRVPYDLAEPLLDEMFTCVKLVTSAGVVRNLMEQDIEEVRTRIKLRKEVWNLHTDFFTVGAPSISESAPAAAPDAQSLHIKPLRRRSAP